MPSPRRRRSGKSDDDARALPALRGEVTDRRITRRDVLRYSTILGAVGLIELKRPHGLLQVDKAKAQGAAVLTAYATRPDDMLSLRFELINLDLQGPPARLVVAARPAYVVVHFGPQAIGEEAIFESEQLLNSLTTPPSPFVKARLAGDSRVAFFVPGGMNEIPFELTQLLDWDQFIPSVVEAARSPEDNEVLLPTLREPTAQETSIEAPWRLYMSPQDTMDWKHSSTPIDLGGRVELWHTRLESPSRRPPVDRVRDLVVDDDLIEMRAVWAKGFNRTTPPPITNDPFRMPLTAYDRYNLVRLTSDFRITGFKPKVAKAETFALSALGAFIDLRGDWVPPKDPALELDVLHWTHRATMGRDHFVRVVLDGFLYPYGHKASLIKITERKFQAIATGPQKGKVGAYLRQRMFVVVREPLKLFNHRDFPFTGVRIKTVTTPNLNPPEQSSLLGTQDAFWMRVGSNDFQFHLEGTDWDGNVAEYTTPLVFVRASTARTESDRFKIAVKYIGAAKERRIRPLEGQKIAYAPGTELGRGDAAVETNTLEVWAVGSDNKNIPLRPRLFGAEVRLQATEQVKGTPLGGNPTIEYHPAYRDGGFDGSEIFARLKKPVELNYGKTGNADRSGGVATPNMDITGLSRKLGPVGGSLKGTSIPPLDPAKYFKDATILGGISLAEVLSLSGYDDAPKLVNSTFPDRLETSLSWDLDGSKLADHLLLVWADGARLRLNARFVTPLNGSSPTFEITGDMRNFAVHLLGEGSAFLVVHFKRLSFEARDGEKPNVDVVISDVEFKGILGFVNELRQFLDTGGDGLNIDVSPAGITAGYTLSVPSVAIGVFSLTNISLSAGVNIPFTGESISTKFEFARRDSPFQVTYTIFGGGGYLGITVGERSSGGFGIQLLEASIEFGGAASIDIGVASGSIHLMAGIYFALGEDDAGCEIALLEGYVRLGGELDVLGIVTVSAEFKMSLGYDFTTGEVWGQATLVIEIEVAMFSESVELSVEKRFGGGDGGSELACNPDASKSNLSLPGFLADPVTPPTPVGFDDIFTTKTEWTDEYAAAFAPSGFAG